MIFFLLIFISARASAKTPPSAFNKKLLKALVVALLKTLNESDPIVRDGSADALGTLSKLMGEKVVAPFMTDVDPLKLAKIKESAEKVVLSVRIAEPKESRPVSRPQTATAAAPRSESAPTKEPRKLVNSATFKKKPASARAESTSCSDSKRAGSASSLPPPEREMSMEEVIEKASEILSASLINQLSDANWKTRLSAVEQMNEMIDKIEPGPGMSQCLLKTLCKKPGMKVSSFRKIIFSSKKQTLFFLF